MSRMFSEVGVIATLCTHFILHFRSILTSMLTVYLERLVKEPVPSRPASAAAAAILVVQLCQRCVTGSLRLNCFRLQTQMVQAMPIDTFLQVIGSAVESPALRLHVSANKTMGAYTPVVRILQSYSGHAHTPVVRCIVITACILILTPRWQKELVAYCFAGDIPAQEQSGIVDGQVRWQWPALL
jgi:hypothetical protein